MNKKGFTLIELLAVIVILAIIALIATPIVLNIIKDSKENAGLRSAEFYLDAVDNSLARQMLDGTMVKDGIYNIMDDGNLCLKLDNNECKNGLIKVEITGDSPKKGSLKIKKGKVDNIEIYLDNKIIVNNGDDLIKIQNPIFDGEVKFANIEKFDQEGIISFSAKNFIPYVNYKITVIGENKEEKIEKLMSFVFDGDAEKFLVLVNKLNYLLICNDEGCISGGVDNIEKGDIIKIEYLDKNIDPHVLRIVTNDFGTYLQIFSTELEEGTAVVEISNSDGLYNKQEVNVSRDEIFKIIEIVGFEQTYALLENGGWVTVTVTQGNNTFTLGSINNSEFGTQEGNDCYTNKKYYYWGNNNITSYFGC